VLTSGTTRQALWFLPGTAILHYRLTQEVIPQIALQTGQALVQNQLEMFLPVEDQFPLQNAVDRFGMPSTSYFVTKNALSTRFVAAPNVTLLLNQAIDSSLINTVSITYEGEPLPVPETQELSEAAQCSNRKALAQHELNHYGESIPLYLTYLQQFPGDAVAHLRLAECYKQSGCLNQAIAQFSLALRFSGFDEPTRQAALQGLNALQIFPNSATAATRPAEQLDIGSPPRMSSLSEDVGF
jgi:tetratricopeptide (TPR) repeat protein